MHSHATDIHASSVIEVEISFERAVGEVVALTSIALAQGLHERGNGGLTELTKRQGSGLLETLYTLRQARPDNFDTIAREEGKRALHARYAQLKGKLNGTCPPFTDAICNELVSWPLDALNRIIAAEMH